MADTDYDLPTMLGTYRKDGSLIREKARVLVEDWLDRIYPRLQDPETPTSTLLSIGESLIRLGDLVPKQGVVAGGGGGFSITINIPEGKDGTKGITISGRSSSDESSAPEIIDIKDFNPLPAKPAWIEVPDFNLNADLSGGLPPPGFDARAKVPVPPRVDGVTSVAPSPTQAARGAFALMRP